VEKCPSKCIIDYANDEPALPAGERCAG